MWTEEKLKEAAQEWVDRKGWHSVSISAEYTAFIAGCKYIINNTQKE